MQDFIAELSTLATPVGRGDFEFTGQGIIQLIPWGDAAIKLHRVWTTHPGQGHGSRMLRALCDLADRHGIEIQMNVTPFGRKPYPMTRDQLHAWYLRHGFEGTKKRMARKPLRPPAAR